MVQTHLEHFPPPNGDFVTSQYSKDGDVWLEVRFTLGWEMNKMNKP